MVLAEAGEVLAHFDGSVEGRILEDTRGAGRFGYDPLFAPEGNDQNFAELGAEVKNGMSHRGRALAKVAAWLEGVGNASTRGACGGPAGTRDLGEEGSAD